jgi:hypothetical protein
MRDGKDRRSLKGKKTVGRSSSRQGAKSMSGLVGKLSGTVAGAIAYVVLLACVAGVVVPSLSQLAA